MFQGGIGPVVAYRHTSHQSRNISHGIAQPSCKLDKWTSPLESEVGIGPTFAVLQTDAYSSIDNSPIEMAGNGGLEPPHKVLETFMLPLTSVAYWNGTPGRIRTDNRTFVASVFIQLAYGSIEILDIPISTRIHVKVWGWWNWLGVFELNESHQSQSLRYGRYTNPHLKWRQHPILAEPATTNVAVLVWPPYLESDGQVPGFGARWIHFL